MTGGNLEVIRRLYEAMDRRDIDAIGTLADRDIVWVPDSRVGEKPVHGLDNVIAFFRDRADMFDEVRTEVERCWETNDQVVAFIHVSGEGAASGAPFDLRIAHLWTLRGGVVVRGEGYGNRGEALAAAGISGES